MSQIVDNIITLVSTDTSLANTASGSTPVTTGTPPSLIILDQIIDLRNAIGGVLQVDFQFATAPTVDKTLEFFMICGLTSTGPFDEYNHGRNISLGSIKVAAATTLQRLSLLLDGGKLTTPYCKLAFYNKESGQTVTIKNMKVVIRKVS